MGVHLDEDLVLCRCDRYHRFLYSFLMNPPVGGKSVRVSSSQLPTSRLKLFDEIVALGGCGIPEFEGALEIKFGCEQGLVDCKNRCVILLPPNSSGEELQVGISGGA